MTSHPMPGESLYKTYFPGLFVFCFILLFSVFKEESVILYLCKKVSNSQTLYGQLISELKDKYCTNCNNLDQFRSI